MGNDINLGKDWEIVGNDGGNLVIKDKQNGNTYTLKPDGEIGANSVNANSVTTDVETIADTTTDPSSNGEIRRNGTDVKVGTGGGVRNLTNIGSGGTNVPDWTEDANSPLQFTASTSGTITLNSTYDAVWGIITNAAGVGVQVDLRVNGDTGSNYGYVSVGGTETTGANAIKNIGVAGRMQGQQIAIAGAWDNIFAGNFGTFAALANRTISGNNSAVASPLDSITMRANDGTSTFDLTMRVFGL